MRANQHSVGRTILLQNGWHCSQARALRADIADCCRQGEVATVHPLHCGVCSDTRG